MTTQPSSPNQVESFARIKVVGVGGGGCNAVDRMIDEGLQGLLSAVAFLRRNCDWGDFLGDVTGALFTGLITWEVVRIVRPRGDAGPRVPS